MDLEDAGGNAAERDEQLPHGVGVAGIPRPRNSLGNERTPGLNIMYSVLSTSSPNKTVES